MDCDFHGTNNALNLIFLGVVIRRIVIFTFILSVFIGIALYNGKGTERQNNSQQVITQISHNNISRSATEAETVDDSDSRNSNKEQTSLGLNMLHGGKLYAVLYSDRFKRRLTVSDIEEIAERFSSDYPEDEDALDDNIDYYSNQLIENQSRISILKALGRTKIEDTSALKSLKKLYLSVAGNEKENWNIRTQSIRNLRLMKNIGDREERERIIAKLDKRFLHLAQYSDEELLNQVIENEQK